MKRLFFLLCIVVVVLSCTNEKTRIFYVNSYHAGYPPSDETMEALLTNLPADSFEVKTAFLNSKAEAAEEVLRKKADSLRAVILEFKPAVVVISDDNAMKYLVEPYADEMGVPVIFCGINWSAAHYRFSKARVTGMLEVLPLPAALSLLKDVNPQGRSLAIVSENSLSEKNNTLLLDSLYVNMGFNPKYFLTGTFDEWKNAFKAAQQTCDFIYLPTNGAIKGWNDKEAREFVALHTSKPVFTCDEFMMPYAVFGLTKIPAEQGEWVALTIRRVSKGEKVSSIEQVRNIRYNVWINPPLAQKTGFNTNLPLLKQATEYQK